MRSDGKLATAVARMIEAGATVAEVVEAAGVTAKYVYKVAWRAGVRVRRRPPPKPTAEEWALACDPDILRELPRMAETGTPANMRRRADCVDVSRDMLIDMLLRDARKWRRRTDADVFKAYWARYATRQCRTRWFRKVGKRPVTDPLAPNDWEGAELGRADDRPAAAAEANIILGHLDESDAELVRDFFGIGRRMLTPQQMAAARGLRSRRAVEVRVEKVIARLRARFNPEGTQ